MIVNFNKAVDSLRLHQHTQVSEEKGHLGIKTIQRSNFSKLFNLFRIDKDQKSIDHTIDAREIKISLKRINSNILNNIKGKNDMQAWKNDEKKVYLSRVVNQEIDNFCKVNQCNVSAHERDQVFTSISNHYNLSLSSSCAQSSINHMVLGNKYFITKMDKLCQGMNRDKKNETVYDFVNKLSDEFYQKNIHDIDINKFRSEVANFITEARATPLPGNAGVGVQTQVMAETAGHWGGS